MKLILARQEFQDALSALATLVGGRTTKPIFGCVKLGSIGDAIELSATDGEAALRLGMPVLSVEQPGEMVGPVDRLLSIVREMTDVEVALEADERRCVIRGEGTEFRIFIMNPADFPALPAFEGNVDLVIDGHALRRAILLTLYAAARETSRYAINGVLWQKQAKRLFVIATDGRRLARAGCAISQAESSDFEAIVPTKALGVFERVFTPPKDDSEFAVDVRVMPNQLLLRSSERVLSTILVEGRFPQYEGIIPSASDKRARIGREELFSAIRQAALLTTEDSRAVRLSFERERLIITSRSPEQGDARVELPIKFDGQPLEAGFNPAYLNDALRVIPFDEVVFELQEASRPGVLSGEDKDEFLYVIMPVSL